MMPEVEDEVEVGTKRTIHYDEYDESVSKVAKSDNVEVRLLLLGRNCGGIIGKGGENITRLRSTYSVNVRMPSTQTPDRVITINGNMDNCVGVIREIFTYATQVPYSTNQQCNIEINLLVQSNTVGSILGKGGARITEIRESTNAKIKVYEECLPMSNERVIAIGGDSEEQLLTSVTTILNILQQEPNRSKPKYYDPANLINQPFNKAGELKGGGVNRSAASNVQSAWGFNVHEGGNGLMGAGYVGNAPLASGGIHPLMSNARSNANVTPDNSPHFLQFQTVTTITAPSDRCGAIIGKGGARIREIREHSGAKITFSETSKGSKEDRIITLTGTQQQVQMAEQLMAQYYSNYGT